MELYEVIKRVLNSNPKNRSPKQIASFLNLSLSQIYRYAESPLGSGTPFPSEKIVQLVLYTGDFSLLKYFANECGLSVIPVPEKKKRHIKEVAREFAKTIKEFSDFVQESSKSLSDGSVTAKEKEHIIKEAWESMEETLFFLEELKHGISR